jgi:membrane-bound lytic murein transglycosylase B
MPARRHTWTIVGASAAVLAVVAAGLFAFAPMETVVEPVDSEPMALWAAPADAPTRAAAPAGPGAADLVDPQWLDATADATGIPERALAAYAGVAIRKSAEMPACGLSWNTLAAIGATESGHGAHDGSTVRADGTATPPIFGIALVGGETDTIPDSDGGVIDGDAEWDRAVGPMQLIPQTWRNWHIDGNGDGVEDPQNIDDATAATANYLCRASGDMATAMGWSAGITAYNSDPDYIVKIAAAGSAYRADSR